MGKGSSKKVWMFWAIFTVLFFLFGYGVNLWQKRDEILKNFLKDKVEDAIMEQIDPLKQILDDEKALIEGAGLKYIDPKINVEELNKNKLFEWPNDKYDEFDGNSLQDALRLPKKQKEIDIERPLNNFLPESLKERTKMRPDYEFPHFGPNTNFLEPEMLLQLNQQFDLGYLIVNAQGSYLSPTFNIIPDYNFPVKVSAFYDTANNDSKLSLSFNEQLAEDWFLTAQLYDSGVRSSIKYKTNMFLNVSYDSDTDLSLNGGLEF
tara:strand:+ start:3739 stop:4527 length:789 start_codon:yes stop_codon:yes gene_type:complete